MAPPSLYHWLPSAADDVSVTLSPLQKPVALPAVIVGVAGAPLTVTVVADDAGDEHPPAVTTTV